MASTSIGTLPVNVGFVGLAAIDFQEDVSGCVMTATVYAKGQEPTNGVGGTPLFSRQMIPVQGQATQQAIPLTVSETAVPTPRALYGKIDVVYPGPANNLPQLFEFKVNGR